MNSRGGVVAFGGDCANALDLGVLSASVGLDMVLYEPAWRSGAEGLQGGLTCTWTDSERLHRSTVTLITYPASIVSAEMSDAASICDGVRFGCSFAGVVGDVWVTLGVFPSSGEAVTRTLWEEAAQRVTVFPAAERATPTPAWWAPVTCEQLSRRVDLVPTTGWQSVTLSSQPDGGTVYTLPESVGGVARCVYSGTSGSMSQNMTIRIIPGGGAYFDAIVATPEARSVTVENASRAVDVLDDALWEGHFATTVATDGTNLIVVGVTFPEVNDPRTGVAAAVLAALAGG
ncbi:hypothetical protein [Microbacterium sp. CJ88]|uniref:hypothetical protein n=1 Tax=Microbacterium sp. CJ88 TaxID=3445672 RepID=UPI003F657DC4